jgi:biopolymer transport protein ExbD/biopolymer transport protein TolR
MAFGAGGGSPDEIKGDINVTPLVDVCLVLLIIFMVVTPMLAKQFWIHLPSKVEKTDPEPAKDDDTAVVVLVTKAGEIMINREKVAEAEFSNRLHRVLAAKGQRTIFFDADEDAEFGTAMKAMDLARGGGADTIAVVTQALAR